MGRKKPGKRNSAGLLAAVLAAAVLVGGGMILISSQSANQGPRTPTEGVGTGQGTAVGVPTANDTTLGPADAPVLVEVFSDFQCIHCRTAAQEVIPPLVQEYAAAGKVRVAFRYFPVLGPESVAAAKGAACAAAQGRFWEYHDWLFANQRGVEKGAFRQARLEAAARELGLDVAAWEQCVASEAADQRIVADLQDGQQRGVKGTPTFFISGQGKSQVIPGVLPYAELRRVVDLLLGQ